MAKTLYSQGGKIEYGIKKYTVDTEADKEALNLRTTKMGSKCYVMDTKKWYILNSSNQWIPFVGEGGSGGSPFDIKGSVPTIDDLPTEDNAIGDLYIVQEDHSEWVWLTNSEEPNGYWEKLGTNILPETIVTATEQMTQDQKIQIRDNLRVLSMDDMEVAIADAVARITVPMAVDGGNLVLNLKQWGGIQGFASNYANGLNVVFVLPMPYLDQTAANTDILAMQLMGIDQENGVFHFEGVRSGKCYYARMTPISANVLSGPLVIRDELPQVTTADNGSILQVANGNWTSATLPSTESLKLTATPTAGPDETTLMSGTWSGATWEEVAAAIQASRLIQLDVSGIGPVTLLYNLGSATNASSNAFVYNVGGTLYNVFAEAGSNNQFKLSIINASTETVNVGGTNPTITPAANTNYKCGELTSLTISNPPATGKYSIIFYSGATPTTTVGIENFVAEANKRYKITVEDNYATYDSWPYTPA